MFQSVRHALSYAYRIHGSEIVKVSTTIADLLQSGIKIPSEYGDLSPHDHHAEAAMILRHVDALPAPQRVLIEGYYDRAMRWPAIELLTETLGYDKVGREAMRELIAAWFGETQNRYGESLSTRSMARRYGGDHRIYWRHGSTVQGQLRALEKLALDILHWQMLDKITKSA